MFLFCIPGAALAVTFNASLDKNAITLGDSAVLSLTFEDAAPANPPAIPNIPNLTISYVGPSTQMSVINGAVSSTTTYNFSVTPKQLGQFTIPSIIAEVKGQKLSSAPLILTVTKPGSSVPGNNGEQLAFLKLVLPKAEIFVGEVVKAELQFYLQNAIQNVGNIQITSFPAEGFNIGKTEITGRSRAQVGSTVYTVVSVAAVLTPIKSGTFTVGPVATRIVVELAPSNNRRDPFDPFGMFNREQRQITLATEPEKIEILPLPGNAPPSFTGAVGNYSIDVTAGPTNVAVGDPVTLRVQINGRGNLDAIALPDQRGWDNFKTYPPTSKVETTDQLGLEGSKTFEEVVTPQSAQIKALPVFAFSFFDPEQKRYQTVTQPAIPITVRPGGSTPAPVVAANKNANDNTPPASRDIVSIKQRLGPIAQITPPLVERPMFLAVQGVPVIALIAAFLWRKRTESLANNPRLRRQRQVAQIVREGLNELHKAAAANDSDAFFATVFRLLQEQLGERLDVPASAITEAVIEERLRPRGVPETTLSSLHELFQTCNLARYAPIKSSQELAAIIPKMESTLKELRESHP